MTVSGGLAPKYKPGSVLTCKLSGTVTNGALVEVSGNGTVAQAAAGSVKVIGVALQSGGSGDLIPVQLTGYVFIMTAKGAVTAGDRVGAASDGSAAVSTVTVSAAGDTLKVAGIALNDIADGATGSVYIFR